MTSGFLLFPNFTQRYGHWICTELDEGIRSKKGGTTVEELGEIKKRSKETKNQNINRL